MATGWFQKASGVFGKRDAPPQPYQFRCDCGEVLSGVRADVSQRPTCSNCGQAHFVLPACQLPIPVSLRREWFGEPVKSPKRKGTGPPPIPAPHRKGDRRGSRQNAPPPPPDKVPAPPPRRRIFTPVTWIGLAIAVTVMLTGALVWRAAHREWARSSISPAIERGLKSLHERNFATASKAFDEATKALDVLGRHDAADLAVRQYQREADAAAQLAGDSATELLQHVAQGNQRTDLRTRFDELVAGKWMLFDAIIDRQAESDGTERWLVDLPLRLGEQPVEVAFDDKPFPALWKSSNDNSRRVIFAAQWDRLELPSEGNRHVLLLLRSSTAVLWCHVDSYQAVAMMLPSGDQEAALKQTLQAQSAALGVGEAP